MKWEGGATYTDDSDDPGGATKYGITLRTAKGEKIDNDGDGDTDKEDVKLLTKEQAAEIYFKRYGSPYAAGLPWPVNICAFDTVANCGPGGLERISYKWKSTDGSVNSFLNCRLEYYLGLIQKNPKLGKYKRGWANRVNDLKKFIEIEDKGA